MITPRRARMAGVVMAAGLGIAALLHRAPPAAPVVAEVAGPGPSVTAAAPLAPRPQVLAASQPGASAPPRPVSMQDLLARGSQEPLVPPDLDLGEIELAPDSDPALDPLVPPTLDLGEIGLAPGSEPSTEPLVPRDLPVPPVEPARP